MGSAAASRIPPAWGFSRDEAFNLAGGNRPGSHWDESRWDKLKNEEGNISPKVWKKELERVNQEVMQKMMEQQAEAARKAAIARAALEEKKRKAKAKADEEAKAEQQRLQMIEEARLKALEEEKQRQFEKANPLRNLSVIHEMDAAGENNIIRCVDISTPIIEDGIDDTCDNLRESVEILNAEMQTLSEERDEFVKRRKKASAEKRQKLIQQKQREKTRLRQQIRDKVGVADWRGVFAYDATAHVFSLKEGHALSTLRGHTGVINVARFSPDRRYVVTGSQDGTARIWDVENPGFKVDCPVESRAILEKDPRYPEKPPRVIAGKVWFKGILQGVRDEGQGKQSYDVAFDEERFVPTNVRNMAPTIDRTCPVNDPILAEIAAAKEAERLANQEDPVKKSEPNIDPSTLKGREKRKWEREQKQKKEEESKRLEEEAKQKEIEEAKRALEPPKKKEPSGIPPWYDMNALEEGTEIECIYRGTEDWAVAVITKVHEIILEGMEERESAWLQAENIRVDAALAKTKQAEENNKENGNVNHDGTLVDEGIVTNSKENSKATYITPTSTSSDKIGNNECTPENNEDSTLSTSTGGIVETVRHRKTNHDDNENIHLVTNAKEDLVLCTREYKRIWNLDYTYIYDIEYQRGRLKGKTERKMQRKQLRTVYAVDDKVSCRYHDGESWLEARVSFVRKNRTYDLKYVTGLRENCVERTRIRNGLAVGDTVRCVVYRQQLARETKQAAAAALALQAQKAGGDSKSDSPHSKQNSKSSNEDKDDRIALQSGSILRVHETTFDVKFDNPEVQTRLPESYFNQRTEQTIKVLRPLADIHLEQKHSLGVADAAFHPAGRVVCSASGPVLHVWYVTNGARICQLKDEGQHAMIKARSTTTTNNANDSISDTRGIKEQKYSFGIGGDGAGWFLSCAFSSGRGEALVAAGHSDYLLVFDWQKQTVLRKVMTREGPNTNKAGIVYALARSPRSIMWTGRQSPALVATVTHDNILRVWDIGTKLMKEVSSGGYAQFFIERPAGQYNRHNIPAFSNDSKWIICGGLGGSLRAWDVESGNLIHNDTNAHEQFISCVAIAPTTKYVTDFWLLSGGSDGLLRVWNCDFGVDPSEKYLFYTDAWLLQAGNEDEDEDEQASACQAMDTKM